MYTGFAGCSVDPGINHNTCKLAWSSRVIKNKIKKKTKKKDNTASPILKTTIGEIICYSSILKNRASESSFMNPRTRS
jgi:hypothetical protein